jgi:hypothetical protein
MRTSIPDAWRSSRPSSWRVCRACVRRFKLSSAHPKHSRAAAAERILAERRHEMTFRPRILVRPSSPSPSSQSSLKGPERIARLAQPRTLLWQKCAPHSPLIMLTHLRTLCFARERTRKRLVFMNNGIASHLLVSLACAGALKSEGAHYEFVRDEQVRR